ncbi:hypothetical protein niasHT_010959 [Heterodera trifolii]|uniref:Uncharacterized protein n=1 Tax=Heterodera trifolii TaxID=157864 RepID=A0ABD2LHI7_9BILA
MVEMELNKNRKLNEKIQKAMERLKVNSFSDLLNAAFQTFFGNCKNCSIMSQKELSGRRKRRMAKQEMGNTSNTANEQNNFSIAGQTLVTQPTDVHNSNETGLELVTHSSDDNDNQNSGTNRVFLNAELPPQNRNLSPTRQALPEQRATQQPSVDHHPAIEHHIDIPPVAHANVHELPAEQGNETIPIAQPARQNQAVHQPTHNQNV